MKRYKCVFVFILMSFALFATDKYKLEDFKLNLNSSLSPPNHLWVMSGWSTVTPISSTVMGVGECFGPPIAGKGFSLQFEIVANDHLIKDNGSTGKGDVGILFSGGQWQPDKIIRNGSYNQLIDNKLISFSLQSELIPLFNRTGFIIKCTIKNRLGSTLDIKINPQITPGNPNFIPLNSWTYGQPRSGSAAFFKGNNLWSNDKVQIEIFSESLTSEIQPQKSTTSYIAVTFSDINMSSSFPRKIKDWEIEEHQAWENRLKWALNDVPVITSTIPGLDDYYKRSIVSGLVTIWENPAFIVNPFIATSGIDGGAVCTYLWDFGGYIPRMASLLLGKKVLANAKAMSSIDIEKYYAYSLDGTGVGVPYSYSTWSFVNLVWEIWKNIGINEDLFNEARRLVLNNEKLESPNKLIDYGDQHNLLEMRTTGWEHYVVSPNAERVWCLERLADMGERIHFNSNEIKLWRDKSTIIKKAILDQLWDTESHWFKCIFPDNHTEKVYSIQVYNAIKTGICSKNMKNDLLGHLKDGAFLFPYGVSSVSAEDTVHYEVNDTDWSGGGEYTGSGPDLVQIMYESEEPDLAMDILKRHFWMGKHLPYYPQEHYVDRPSVPAHKRANECCGLSGADAILYGMIGFSPRIDGSLWLNPQVPVNTDISVSGYGWKGYSVDVTFHNNLCTILLNGKQIYHGIPKLVLIK